MGTVADPSAAAGIAATVDAREDQNRASLAVLPFELRSQSQTPVGWRWDENGVADKIITSIAATRKFRLLERRRVDAMMEEFNLSHAETADPAHAARAGAIVGADYLLLGAISELTCEASNREVPYTDRYEHTLTGSVSGGIRVVDARTGEIVAGWDETVHDSAEGKGKAPQIGGARNTMLERMQHEFASKIAIRVIDAVYPPKIVKIAPGGKLWINRGAGGGLSVGDRLEVLSVGETITDVDTGEQLGTCDWVVGHASVTETLEKVTLALLLDSEIPVTVGMKVRAVAAARAPGRESSARRREEKKRLAW